MSTLPTPFSISPSPPATLLFTLPIELVQYIIALAIESYPTIGTIAASGRKHTLLNLCLVSSELRAVAQPMLFNHVYFDINNRMNILKLVARLKSEKTSAHLIRTFELRLDIKDESPSGRIALRSDETDWLTAIFQMCSRLENLIMTGVRKLSINFLAAVTPTLSCIAMSNVFLIERKYDPSTSYDTPVSPPKFPRLRSLVLYQVNTYLGRPSTFLHPDSLPAIETMVYVGTDLGHGMGIPPPFPTLKKLGMVQHHPHITYITSSHPNGLTLNFTSAQRRTPHSPPMDDRITGEEKHMRFLDPGFPGNPDNIMGTRGLLSVIPKLESVSLPREWAEKTTWKLRMDELEQLCTHKGISLELEKDPCRGLEYFLRPEIWQVPEKMGAVR